MTSLQDDLTQTSLVQVGVWCLGEYGNLALLPPTEGEEGVPSLSPSEDQVVDLLVKVVTHLNFVPVLSCSNPASHTLVCNQLITDVSFIWLLSTYLYLDPLFLFFSSYYRRHGVTRRMR